MNFQNIPNEIKELKQWVCSYHNSKVPMRATCSQAASSVEPSTWSTFNDAVMSVECGNYDNVGFVFNDNGIVGIDIDVGYDGDDFLSPIAADIISACKSYTEKSRSGRGVHILLKGTLPFSGKNNLSGVEIYQRSRYFILTGDVILYKDIAENQQAIDYILHKYFSATPTKVTSMGTIADRIYKPEWLKHSDGKINLRPVYPRIPEGCRNICLTSLAGMMHNQGYTSKQIYDEIAYCNKVACEPLLHDRELRTIVNSVTRYKR